MIQNIQNIQNIQHIQHIQHMRHIKEAVDIQQLFVNSLLTRSYEHRINALTKLKNAIIQYEDQLSAALFKDLGKSQYEAYATEIGFVLHDLSITLKSLKKWMCPKKVATPFYCQPASWFDLTLLYPPYAGKLKYLHKIWK